MLPLRGLAAESPKASNQARKCAHANLHHLPNASRSRPLFCAPIIGRQNTTPPATSIVWGSLVCWRLQRTRPVTRGVPPSVVALPHVAVNRRGSTAQRPVTAIVSLLVHESSLPNTLSPRWPHQDHAPCSLPATSPLRSSPLFSPSFLCLSRPAWGVRLRWEPDVPGPALADAEIHRDAAIADVTAIAEPPV